MTTTVQARLRRFALARRAGALAVAVLLALVVLPAAPAWAHGRGADATNYRSAITEQPDLPGVSWRIAGGDELLVVVNESDAELMVLGYDGEPYLRVGPDGVWRNRNSEATYLNEDRYARVGVPPHVDPQAPPDWERLSGAAQAAWHEHRIHWMSPDLPPAVRDAPGETVAVMQWEVPFVYDGQELALEGRLDWVPPGRAWPWLAGGLAAAAALALAGARTRPSEDRWTGLARPAALVLGVVSGMNLTNLVNDVAAVPLPAEAIVFSVAQTILFVGMGLFGAMRGWAGDYAGFTALGIGSAAIHFGQGILLLDVLTSSQLATLFPPPLARASVAASLVQLLPVLVIAWVGARRLSPLRAAHREEHASA